MAAPTERERLEARIPNLRIRARVLRALRDFFEERGYLEVETPARVPSPGLELHLEAIPSGDRWLATSPEYQMKRLLCGGLERIYQIGHAYRAQERGPHHVDEFTMLEWYRAGATLESLMRETEALVAHVAWTIRGAPTLSAVDGRTVDASPGWDRVSVGDAFRDCAGIRCTGSESGAELAARARETGLQIPVEVRDWDEVFARVFVEAVEPALGWERPVFLYRWPARQAALARLDPGDPEVAERFEVLAGGLELANAFCELTDAREQRARMDRERAERRARGLEVYPIDERFLSALEQGMGFASGIALGVDRLVMLLSGARHIDEVIAFAPEEL